MKEENPVHFRLGYYESVEAKKDILSSEMFLLNMTRTLRKYYLLRAEELKIRTGIQKAIKKLNVTIKKTESFLPVSQMPEEEIEKPTVKKTKMSKEEKDLESQLRDIQAKLRAIS